MDNHVDVELIMSQIKAEIKENGFKDSDLSFEDIWSLEEEKCDSVQEQLSNLLDEMERKKQVLFYRELSGNPVKKFVKRVVRKLIAFIIQPIVDEQNDYNEYVYNICRLLVENMEK